MGWKQPTCWIEKRTDDNYWQCTHRLDNVADITYSKVILLGHGKYGSESYWKPLKKLKGFPRDLSDTIERYVRGCGNMDPCDVTYYTLEELKSIDQDGDMGIPKEDENFSIDRRKNIFRAKIKLEEREERVAVPADKDLIKNNIYSDEETIIKVYAGENKIIPKYEVDRLGEEFHDIEKLSEKEGELVIEPRKKSSYYSDIANIIEKLEELKESKELSEKDVRIIIWSAVGGDKTPRERLGYENLGRDYWYWQKKRKNKKN